MIEYEIVKEIDADVLARLAQEIWQEYSPCFISHEQIEYMLKKFQSSDAIISQIKDGYRYYFIKSNTENIGYFAFQIRDTALFLSKIYIKQGFRSKGIGTQTFMFIKKIAQKLNMKTIFLTVNKYNTNSIKAYNKWGFFKKKEEQFDIGSGYIMDDYILECSVKI